MRGVLRSALGAALLVVLLVTTSFAQVTPPVPRREFLIVDAPHGRLAVPDEFNAWKIGASIGNGIHQMVLDGLWYLDPQTGELISALAVGPPEYNADFTQMTVRLREGIYWSDGVPFTADDVVFTIEYHAKHTGLTHRSWIVARVAKVSKTDDYTVVFELREPYPALHLHLTAVVYSTLYMMPKHVFEKVDNPLVFKFDPPVSLGPYVLHSFDPAGFWWMYERRTDWQRTSVGKLYGMPNPRYVMFISHGPDERKVMAQARHELDLIFDLVPEAWEVLRGLNPHSTTWYKDFPWAWMDDVRARFLGFNTERHPFNLRDVRWALALSLDVTRVFTAGFDGIGRLNPLYIAATEYLQSRYYESLLPWLNEFELEPGYRPWDPTVPNKLAEHARTAHGVRIEEPARVFGPGWWRHDPAMAERLLVRHGFRRGAGGRWLLPDGTPWRITYVAPVHEVHVNRLAFAVAEQWRSFGIDVTVNVVEAAPFSTAFSTGTFDVISQWAVPATDAYTYLMNYHSSFFNPTGTPTGVNQIRWKHPRADELLDQLRRLPPDSAQADAVILEFLKLWLAEAPAPVVKINLKFSPADEYYWTNYPIAQDPYQAPVWWWGQFKFMLPFITSTGR